MNGLPTPATAPAEVYYPDSDGKSGRPEAHLLALLALNLLLRQHFRGRVGIHVVSGVSWCYQEDDPNARLNPDIMVVRGDGASPSRGRRSFNSWEERGIPCFILELILKDSVEAGA